MAAPVPNAPLSGCQDLRRNYKGQEPMTDENPPAASRIRIGRMGEHAGGPTVGPIDADGSSEGVH